MTEPVVIRLAVEGARVIVADVDKVSTALEGVTRSATTSAVGSDRLAAALGRVSHYGLASGGLAAVAALSQKVGAALFSASVEGQRLQTQLNFAGGGAGAREMGFVADLANRLGLELGTTARAYAGLAAAARGTTLEGVKTRQVFESIASASAVMGLSADQSSGALLAIQQMMSKGIVSAEEFRGQLGERLPIALQAGANALGVTTAEFSKLLETGQIVATDFLPKFSVAIREMLGDSVQNAAERLEGATLRMANAWERLKRTTGDAGISRALANEAQGISNYLDGLSDAMDKARASGAGLVGQLSAGLGTALARMPFDLVAGSANLLNTAINQLSFGAVNLRTNINLLPDALQTTAQQAAQLDGKLRTAEAELARLSARLQLVPDNIYLKSETHQAYLYVQQLRAVKKARDDLAGAQGGRGSVNPQTVEEMGAAQNRLSAAMAKYATQGEKAAKAIEELRAAHGALFTPEMEKRVRAQLDPAPAGSAGGIAKATLKATTDYYEQYLTIVSQGEKTALEDIADQHAAGILQDAAYYQRRKEIAQRANTDQQAVIELQRDAVAASGLSQQDKAAAIETYNRQLIKLRYEEQRINKTFDGDMLQLAARAQAALSDLHARSTAAYIRQLDDRALADANVAQSAIDYGRVVDEANARTELELSLMGATKQARAIAIAQYDIELRLQRQILDIKRQLASQAEQDAAITSVTATAQREKDLARADIIRKDNAQTAKAAADEWAKAAEKIQDTLTNALMRGFESGKTFASNLRDTLVNMFKTLVLRPVISAVVSPVSQALTGTLGLASAANAAGGGASVLSGAGSLLAGGGASIFGSGGLGGALAGGAGWLTGATSLTGALSAGASLIGTGSVAGLASGVGVLAGALGPIALGIGVLSSLFGGDKNKQQNTGNATSYYDATGVLTRQDAFFGGSSASADSVLAGLQQAYAKAAAGLAIGTVSTAFNFGSNVRKDGSDPRFALGGYAGGKSFQQTETASSEAAISLAASRAVFAALQGSQLPAYLAGVFNSIDPGAASQEQITATLGFAQSLKQVREALTETRTPLQILQDNLVAGTAALKTSADTFKTDFIAAIDAGLSPESLAQWQGLQTTMDQLAAASGKADDAITAVTRSLADIANERARLQDQYDNLTLTSAQLITKQRDGLDASNHALFDQVQALIALKDAAAASAEAAQASAAAHAAAAATERAAAGLRLSQASGGASDALAGLQRAVAAQQAADTAAYQAQKDAAGAIYKAQASALQTNMDTVRASLDAVSTSVGRLKSLSGSLKSSLDGMRIAGSDAASRADAQAQIGAALARARSGGGLPLDGELNSALATVARPSEQLFATFSDYAKDFYRTANDISALSTLTDAQLTADEATQTILKSQVDALSDQQKLLKEGFEDQVSSLDAILSNAQNQLDAANGINTSVLSVADALAIFNQRILGLTAERARQDLATSRGTTYTQSEIVTAVRGALQSGYSVADVYNTAADSYGVGASTITNATNGQGLTGFDTATGARTQDYAQGQIADAIRYNLDHGMSIADIYRLGGANYGLTGAEIARAGKAAGIPGFRVGTNYVPHDMLAQLHQGEAVVPRAYNPAAGASAVNNTARLEALVEKLIAQVADLYASSEHGNAEIARGSNAVNGKQGAPIVVQIIDKNGVLA